MTRRNRGLVIVGALVALALILHVALPHVVKSFVNRRLQALQGYDGSIEDIDIALWRGAYRIDGLRIVREGRRQPTPFFASRHMDLSVEWRNLFRGSLVATAVFERPELNLVQEASQSGSQLGKGVDWHERLEELFPFRFNTISATNGRVTFRAPGIATKEAIHAENVEAAITNLTNVFESGKDAFAGFVLSGTVLGDAPVKINGRADPREKQPTFDVNLQLERVQLPKLNPWLRRFARIDAETGDFDMYIEVAAKEGRFRGYVKPVMRDVNIYEHDEPEENPLRRVWEQLVEVVAELFENQSEEQVATRIPFSGTVDDPDVGLLASVVGVLRNAFVGAFARSLEGTVRLTETGVQFGEGEAAPGEGATDGGKRAPGEGEQSGKAGGAAPVAPARKPAVGPRPSP